MVMPLDLLQAGDWAEVANVDGDPSWVGRLAELGLREGAQLCVLQPGSPCLLQIASGKLCLRGGECSQILVVPISSRRMT
jgi:Fe2+ transport system protein FeoA